MAHIHIRGVDDGLLKALKLRALEDGTTLKDWVVDVLSKAVEPEPAVNAGPCETPKISKPRARKEAVPEPEPQYTADSSGGGVAEAARAVLSSVKSDPAKIPGVRRGKHFTDTWG